MQFRVLIFRGFFLAAKHVCHDIRGILFFSNGISNREKCKLFAFWISDCCFLRYQKALYWRSLARFFSHLSSCQDQNWGPNLSKLRYFVLGLWASFENDLTIADIFERESIARSLKGLILYHTIEYILQHLVIILSTTCQLNCWASRAH